jgi:hypothetical protein
MLKNISIVGPNRIAKVIPVTPHRDDVRPSEQYPMGAGALQWRIRKDRPCRFLVAMHVDRSGIATTPLSSVPLIGGSTDALYANRVRVKKYLESA